jgi:very-short-patch-repair endonuclease
MKKPPLKAVGQDGESRADEMIREAAEHEAIRFVEAFGVLKRKCESPIEELLMAALFANERNQGPECSLHFCAGEPPEKPTFNGAAFIYQQANIGPYRVDILILDASMADIGKPVRWIVVECDGHDFHERTKSQARRDKQRDRFLQSKGYKVLRFTGSEIWADPEQCAEEVTSHLTYNDAWRNRDQ